MDLPKSKMGVDIEHGFKPEYVVIRGKGKIISEIKKAAKAVDVVYLAPDPDREGEAIAWHLAQEINSSNGNIKRVLFNEITKRGITEALQHPGEIDMQQVRVAAGAAHPRPAGRLRDLADPVEEGEARAVGRARAVGGGAHRRRARARRSARSSRTSTGPSKPTSRGTSRRRSACAWSRSTARRPSSATARTRRRVVEELKQRQVRRRQGRAQGAQARIRWRRSSPRACSRRRRASCASPPRRRWRWRSGCTKASSSATRARSVSSRTCAPTRRVCPTTPSPRRARTSPSATARSTCPTSRWSTRRRRRRRTRTRRSAPPRCSTIRRRSSACWSRARPAIRRSCATSRITCASISSSGTASSPAR